MKTRLELNHERRRPSRRGYRPFGQASHLPASTRAPRIRRALVPEAPARSRDGLVLACVVAWLGPLAVLAGVLVGVGLGRLAPVPAVPRWAPPAQVAPAPSPPERPQPRYVIGAPDAAVVPMTVAPAAPGVAPFGTSRPAPVAVQPRTPEHPRARQRLASLGRVSELKRNPYQRRVASADRAAAAGFGKVSSLKANPYEPTERWR